MFGNRQYLVMVGACLSINDLGVEAAELLYVLESHAKGLRSLVDLLQYICESPCAEVIIVHYLDDSLIDTFVTAATGLGCFSTVFTQEVAGLDDGFDLPFR